MAASAILPIYQRYVNGVPVPQGRKTLRLREKYIILLVFVTFAIVCMCAFLYLPNLHDKVTMGEMRKKLQDAGDGLFLPQARVGPDGVPLKGGQILPHDDGEGDPHQVQDQKKLQDKIVEAWEQQKLDAIVTKLKIDPEEAEKLKDNIKVEKESLVKKREEELEKQKKLEKEKAKIVNKDHDGHPGARGGEPSDPEAKARRDKVREMMKHAWTSYEKYAWGGNELRPISRRAHTGSIFGSSSLGASIVDAVDTLYIMELDEEYKKARDWIATTLSFDKSSDLSVFETTIRFVGGLLSAYALTGDQMFKTKAKDVADRLLPAFKTPTGLPYAIVNLKSGSYRNYGWASGGCSILSEVGTLHLEFDYMSDVSKDPVYREKVMKVRKTLQEVDKPNGLYPNYINPKTGKFCQHHVSMGALGDSFYEYLLKEWLISNKKDTVAKQMYDEAMKAVDKTMLQTSRGGLKYYAEYRSGHLEHKMEHLACFTPGMVGMAAMDSPEKEKYLQLAEDLAHTCHESYRLTATGLGPEAFRFESGAEAKASRMNEKYYIQRPEVLEGWFYMWRLTKKQKYRDWAWEMVQALEKHSRTDGGFSGIRDVYQPSPAKDDVQQSFFLAETLKYLYLIFSDDSLIPLDKWVMNTEAHPLPVHGTNPAAIDA